MEAADSIQSAYALGITHRVLLADLIDYSTRCPQFDTVATAAAELLATLPVTSRRQHRRRRVPLAQCYRPEPASRRED